MYFFLHKSWIWRTLGHDTKEISYWHFHYAPKEYFCAKKNWISCKGSKVSFWQKWKIAKMALLNLCIQKFFWPKSFFWSIMKMAIRIFFRIITQGPPNPGFMQEKVQKGDFLKKPLRESIFFCCFRFLWISWRPGTLNWKRLVFLLSKILYKKCEKLVTQKSPKQSSKMAQKIYLKIAPQK